jgi:hypothetical protein
LERADFAEIAEDLRHVRVAADDVSYLSHKLNSVADRAAVMEDNVSLLASDLRRTTHRFNRMLNDRKFSGDLKTIANTAKDAAEHLDNAMARVQSVASDKESMANVAQALTTLDEATQNVRETVARIEVIGADKELRGDAKQIVSDAKDTVLQVDKIVGRPGFGTNLKSTLGEAKEAFHRMAHVGAQLEQILDKRAPLLHMLVGRPGHLEERSRVAGGEKNFE